MLGALLFGLAASSALVIGGVAGAFWRPPRALVAAALAFASGALITALAFDLFEESFRAGGVWFSGLGLLVGPAAFVAADEWLDHHIERARGGVPGFAILAAVTLDGIPENMALGVTLLEGTGSVVLLVAIFASNLPESLGGAVGMRDEGRSEGFVILIWALTALLLAASVVVGHAVLLGADERLLSVLLAFGCGAVLASLADTLMPDAYREGGALVAFATAAGFFLSFMIESA
jgi:ZIP family zinc transporter